LAPGDGATRARSRPAIEHPNELHLHLHDVSAEDVAVILARRDE